MKLSKAIEINAIYLPTHRWPQNPDLQKAMKLGIEALKAISDYRQGLVVDFSLPLPSETPETDPP